MSQDKRTKLIAALDTADRQQALDWADQFGGHVDALKVGLELTYAAGFETVKTIGGMHNLFLDLKLHDIPNTVASGLEALLPLNPVLTTLHALGGAEMITRARQAMEDHASGPRPRILAVTVLTSMNAPALEEIGISASPLEEVLRLGKMAIKAGADGLVCSAHEVAALREALGDGPELVVPGIRPEGSAANDQKRIMTPAQAARAGADWIVVGRPITQSADPLAAVRAIQDELASA